MASDQRFQRTVQAVAEAVQIFATGTFDFAESIKQIWGPQTQPDAVETSNHLPVEGMQDVQVVDQLRDRTPVSQDGDQLAINSHGHPPSMTLHDGEGTLELLHEAIVPLDTANMQLSNDMDVVAGSLQDAVRSCYECFARWQDESPFPPCLPTLVGPCDYCTRMQIHCKMIPVSEIGKMMQRKREQDLYLAAQNGNVPIKSERFQDAVYETCEPLGMPLSSPIVDAPQQQVGSKRAYHDINEQQPISKRQRLQELRQELVPKDCRGKIVLRQEQNDHRAAAENGESSSSSAYLSSSKEAVQIKMAMNRQESSPVETSDLSPVAHKVTDEDVTHLEGENDGSSSFTQKESLEDWSSNEDESDYSSSSSSSDDEEEAAVQIPAVKESLQEDNMKAETTIRSLEESSKPSSSSSSSSSEDETSEEGSDDEPEELEEQKQKPFTKGELPKEPKDNSKELMQLSDDESSSSSSEDESSDEESEAEPEEQPRHQLTPEAFSQEEHKRMMKEAMLNEDNESASSSSSSEDESSAEESDDEPEEPEKHPATKVEPQTRREENPEEPIEITSDESSSSSSEDESSEEDSE